MYQRYGRATPSEDEEPVGAVETPENTEENQLQNDNLGISNEVVDSAKKSIAKARAQDLEGVARELTSILSVDDPQAVLKGLRHFILNSQMRAKHLISNPDRLAHEIEKLLATSFLSGTQLAPKV